MTTTTKQTFQPGDVVEVKGHGGVAWRIDHRPKVFVPESFLVMGEDGEEEIIETSDGDWEFDESSDEWVCHMVGDDRPFTHDESDLIILDEDDYCAGCGQIGCGHG